MAVPICGVLTPGPRHLIPHLPLQPPPLHSYQRPPPPPTGLQQQQPPPQLQPPTPLFPLLHHFQLNNKPRVIPQQYVHHPQPLRSISYIILLLGL